MPTTHAADFEVKLATTDEDLRAAQRLRYQVFVRELGAQGHFVDHDAELEKDPFDVHADHLLLRDRQKDEIVGVYRVLRQAAANAAGGFYSASEYDLNVLESSGRRLLELGRSCIHPEYRNGLAMHRLWTALAQYIRDFEIEVLFGVASFHGTNATQFTQPLALLHHRYLAPASLRVTAHASSFHPMDAITPAALDHKQAMVQVPGLIKAYLRLGGFVGHGAYVDHAFNTTDVCLILDTTQMRPGQAQRYTANSQ
ncbi:MAG: GNAT family N-acyltransferase [Pseudomonadota bacterium]